MEIDAKAPEGNAFAIMGVVCELLKQAGRGDEVSAVRQRMMEGNYQNLCDVAEEVTNGAIIVANRDEL